MLGEELIREALDLKECPLCRDGWPVFQGLHELPEPAGMFRCLKTQKESDQMTYERAVTEQELTEKAVAPRVTDEQVEAFITSEHYFTGLDGVIGATPAVARPIVTGAGEPKELAVLTFCVLVLANGFTVHGMSACADPNNFDPEIGKRIARANAKAHVWGHLGFELRSKLDMVEKANPPSNNPITSHSPNTKPHMTTHVGTKVVHAMPMSRSEYNTFRGWDLPADENGADEGYLVEYADGGDANVAGFAGYVSWSPKEVFDRAYGEPLR